MKDKKPKIENKPRRLFPDENDLHDQAVIDAYLQEMADEELKALLPNFPNDPPWSD